MEMINPLFLLKYFNLTTDELKDAIKRSVSQEMCMTIEDFLSRRTRSLLLDAKAAIEPAPAVATMMAAEMNKDENWIKEQIDEFQIDGKQLSSQLSKLIAYVSISLANLSVLLYSSSWVMV